SLRQARFSSVGGQGQSPGGRRGDGRSICLQQVEQQPTEPAAGRLRGLVRGDLGVLRESGLAPEDPRRGALGADPHAGVVRPKGGEGLVGLPWRVAEQARDLPRPLTFGLRHLDCLVGPAGEPVEGARRPAVDRVDVPHRRGQRGGRCGAVATGQGREVLPRRPQLLLPRPHHARARRAEVVRDARLRAEGRLTDCSAARTYATHLATPWTGMTQADPGSSVPPSEAKRSPTSGDTVWARISPTSPARSSATNAVSSARDTPGLPRWLSSSQRPSTWTEVNAAIHATTWPSVSTTIIRVNWGLSGVASREVPTSRVAHSSGGSTRAVRAAMAHSLSRI